MLSDLTPFKLAGNIYFVGTHEASSHLIDTGDGLILIDTGYERTADVVVDSMALLGFDIKDVKIILHSHGHYDHTDATPKLLTLSNAKTYLAKEDLKYIKGWTPDYYYEDGGVITLGNTSILCLATPGHTEGTYSFFFDVQVDGKTYRAGMFGGAGTNQLKKQWLDDYNCSWQNRGLFYSSIEKLKKEHVDIFLGNHTWNNQTAQKARKMLETGENPFIDDTAWLPFICQCEKNLDAVILEESRTKFVNYAHRGASEYAPENTLLSFYTGLFMGANGIETDVRKTKDGVLVLFHDDTITRLTGEDKKVSDLTLEELKAFTFEKNGLCDKVVTFEDFLKHFSFRDITFAIELKEEGIEKDVADMLSKYKMQKKTIVTSFLWKVLEAFKLCAPEFRVGYLCWEVTENSINFLKKINGDEICPQATQVTPENVAKWHRDGFNVRAWGVKDETLMKQVYDSLADGMTVNFPDLLKKYISEKNQ